MFGKEKSIREKCSSMICQTLYKKESRAIIDMANEFDDYTSDGGWGGQISCATCGRQVEYVGNRYESKKDVERKLRLLWHVANHPDEYEENA